MHNIFRHLINNGTATKAGGNRWKIVLYLVFLCALTAIVYMPAKDHEFQRQWDDPSQVSENPDIRELSFKSIKKIFSSTYVGMYQPIPTLTYAIEYKLWGAHPSVFHTTNIFLHLVNILLVFWFVLLLAKGDKLAAAIAASLFALHPMNVETVAWVSTRSNLIFAGFFFLSLISYMKYLTGGEKRIFYRTAMLLFLLALLSKSQAIVLPPILVLLDIYFKKQSKKQVWEKLPFFVLAIIFGVITYYTRKPEGDNIGWDFSGITEKILLMSYAIPWYLWKLIAPFNLCAVHYYPIRTAGYLPWIYYVSPLILILLSILIWKIRRKIPELVYALFFFIISISVTLPLFILGSFVVADRYTYIPFVGLFWFIGIKFSKLLRKPVSSFGYRRIMYFSVFALLILSGYSYLSRERNFVWRNGMTFYVDVVCKKPWSYLGWYSLGNIYQDKGDNKNAVCLYKKSISINPFDADVYCNLSSSYFNLFDYWSALWYIDLSINLKDNLALTYMNRASYKAMVYDYQNAYNDYSKALSIDSSSYITWSGRAYVMMKLNAFKAAINDFNRSISLNDDFDENGYLNRGICYFNLKRYYDALYDFMLVINRNGRSSEAYHNVGALLVNVGKYKEAKMYLTKAIIVNGDNFESYMARGIAHFRCGEYYQALNDLNKSISLNKLHPQSYLNKALVLIALNENTEALENINTAILIDKKDPVNYYNRGILFYHNSNYDKAISDFSRTLQLSDTMVNCYIHRGLSYEKMGDLNAAERDYTAAIELSSGKNKTIYVYRGQIRTKLKKIAGALSDFENATNAITIEGAHIYHNNYGVALMGAGKYREAVAEFNKALLKQHSYYDALANRGIALYESGDCSGALVDLEIVTKHITDNPDIYYYKAKANSCLKKYANANIDFTRAINKDPLNAFYYYERAMNKSKAGNILGAISDFTSAIELDSLNPVYYLDRGNSYTAISENNNALTDYLRSVTIRPDYADAYYNAAYIKKKSGDFVGAIHDFSRVIDNSPHDHEAYFQRGLAKFEIGDTDGACGDWLAAANLGSIKTNLYVLAYCIKFIDINAE